ncbi:hypothetical protein TNCV_3531911 [Trichonephila clavipes]|nr:hypothetical protein TNCV_3531911 [Trichonephila clavipes]
MADFACVLIFMFVLGVRLKGMITLSRVGRSFLICCSVNVMTSVPVWVPSSCTGSEASSVRTGQWGSPIGRWVFVNFCVHEVCERMSDVE